MKHHFIEKALRHRQLVCCLVRYTLVQKSCPNPYTKKERFFMPSANQTPGAGNYQCTKCGLIVTLKSPTEKLPVCPKCRATEYIRKK